MKLCHHPRPDSLNITVIENEVKQSPPQTRLRDCFVPMDRDSQSQLKVI